MAGMQLLLQYELLKAYLLHHKGCFMSELAEFQDTCSASGSRASRAVCGRRVFFAKCE